VRGICHLAQLVMLVFASWDGWKKRHGITSAWSKVEGSMANGVDETANGMR
jgi:hypothetical protein